MTLSIALLRRLALGLPLIVLPPAAGILVTNTACTSCDGGCSAVVRTRAITAAQRARFPTADGSTVTATLACREVCAELDVATPDAFVSSEDGGPLRDVGPTEDAGPRLADVSSCDVRGMQLTCNYSSRCIGGRAPQGLQAVDVRQQGIASLFAEMAHLETAAIPAFEDLAEELALHGAPRTLRRAARRGAEDERRHARSVSGLAGRYGGVVPEVVRRERTPRSLFAMAADNAFEGCVREAYGAVEAAHQAAQAADPAVRAAFTAIAREEAQHALLSLAIDGWARGLLSAREGRALDALREEGVAHLRAGLEQERVREVRVLAGMPNATRANDLLSLVA